MKKEFLSIEDFKRTDKSEIFYLSEEDGRIPMLRYPLFDSLGMVSHGFTTRLGGVSEGIYEALNLSYSRGDKKECVDENFKRVAGALHSKLEDFVFSDQTHTINVRMVTREDAGKGLTRELDYQDVDGLVTDVPGLVLSTFYADCVPLFFVDPVHQAIGLSHSGWRGTVGRMGKMTLQVMEREYKSRPEEVYCAIGPSICQKCYEVSEDVAEKFMQEFPEGGQELCFPTVPGKFQLNLWKANELVLREAGVQKDHLAITNICTCCNEKLLFSHRASKGRRGNLGAFLKLNSN